MIVLAGADLVLPTRILGSGSLIVDEDRIVAVDSRDRVEPAGATVIDARDRFVVPGFIDVHVHGIEGHDTLDGDEAIRQIASRLPRYGVTAFCPTSVACPPSALRQLLSAVGDARISPRRGSARVLPAHLESNFISPEFKGAQPGACLRLPTGEIPDGTFSGRDVLDVIEERRADVGIITVAPELPGLMDLVRALDSAGHRVSLGHSGASYEQAMAAIDAGARHATHLFNRMTPLAHRAPGLAGAVLSAEDVTAELICDGYHVHEAMCRVAVAAKTTAGVMAITDGTAGSGLSPGASARLGGQHITIGEHAAFLPDGTLAGSTLTMDRAFRAIVTQLDLTIVDAATMCATTPARALGLTGLGAIADGALADIVVLDRAFRVWKTFVAGREVYASGSHV
jgi:N-acetylglucosamine-6-phosphate deacetylase